MEIKLDVALERDIDLLIIEEFISSPDFAKIFLDTVSLKGVYTIDKAIHSKTDTQYGESDIVIILNINNQKHALHIEDKINAIAMPKQHDRYLLRGQKDIKIGEYDDFSVILVAPKKYLEANLEAHKYKNQIPYEVLQNYFKSKTDTRSKYKLSLIEKAICEQEVAHTISLNPCVVAFHEELRKYQKEHYLELPMGSVAWWSYFKTNLPNVSMVYKADRGYCDLQFGNCTQSDLYNRVKDLITSEMLVVKATKSASVRINVPKVDLSEKFEDNIEEVDEALEALSKLYELSKKLPPVV